MSRTNIEIAGILQAEMSFVTLFGPLNFVNSGF